MNKRTATFAIGGTVYEVPPLTSYALRNCFDDIKKVGEPNTNVMEAMTAMIRIVACGLELHQEFTIEDLVRKLDQTVTPGDIDAMNIGLVDLLNKSGMTRSDSPSGEAQATISTETGTVSSPS